MTTHKRIIADAGLEICPICKSDLKNGLIEAKHRKVCARFDSGTCEYFEPYESATFVTFISHVLAECTKGIGVSAAYFNDVKVTVEQSMNPKLFLPFFVIKAEEEIRQGMLDGFESLGLAVTTIPDCTSISGLRVVLKEDNAVARLVNTLMLCNDAIHNCHAMTQRSESGYQLSDLCVDLVCPSLPQSDYVPYEHASAVDKKRVDVQSHSAMNEGVQ